MEFTHKTVLFDETLEYMNIKADGIYVDGTAGGGGLSLGIASKLNENGRLICIDRDPDAILVCKDRLGKFGNVNIIEDNFANISSVVHNFGICGVDAVALDLGVSSYQLDAAERGFSYSKDAKLDMRMSKSGMSAYDVVNGFSSIQLRDIISRYGEEKFALRIANAIVNARINKRIETTLELSEIVTNAIPCAARRTGGHPAKRTFQAIRIFVNDELNSLAKALDESFKCLKVGGRLAVITFHSLEDRMVKIKMKEWAAGCTCPPDFPVCVCGNSPMAKVITRKAVKPSQEEINANLRSRSAKLRVCEKLK